MAKDLGIGRATAFRWCQDGVLPAIKMGRTWRIPLEPYLKWKGENIQREDSSSSELLTLIDDWINFLTNGPRPLSPRTVEGYRYYFQRYLKRAGGASTPAEITARDTMSRVLEGIPVASYSNRYNLYFSVCSFAKYLIGRGLLPEDVYPKLKTMRPKWYFPSKRTVMEEGQIKRFLDAIWLANGNSPYERQLNFAMIIGPSNGLSAGSPLALARAVALPTVAAPADRHENVN